MTAAFWAQSNFKSGASADATRSAGQVIGNRVCAVFSLLFILIPLAVTAGFISRTQMRQYVRRRAEVYQKRMKATDDGQSGPLLPRLAAGEESALLAEDSLIGATPGVLSDQQLGLVLKSNKNFN